MWGNPTLFHWAKSFFFKKKKNLGEYHDLYVQSNTLLLADVYYIYVILLINMKKIITNTWKIMIEIKNHHISSVAL